MDISYYNGFQQLNVEPISPVSSDRSSSVNSEIQRFDNVNMIQPQMNLNYIYNVSTGYNSFICNYFYNLDIFYVICQNIYLLAANFKKCIPKIYI